VGEYLNAKDSSWPVCDALISYFSDGFPIDKAIEYQNLRKPFLTNDLEEMKRSLLCRKGMVELMSNANIPTPKRLICDRTDPNLRFEDLSDRIVVNGEELKKPFVEKPFDAEDHDVYIYYSMHQGGGRQELFRKVGDVSSRYKPIDKVRTDGSFIYEEFVMTNGMDIKAYAVGDYIYAEARKCPGLDGKGMDSPSTK